ncbi:ATP-binding cassette domain-containing protein [Streptomyces sp. YGL11-2]|uniref:ATP-binding cassette domain-containing protein n=1 Tax=Streptomyces sp. YGL11-2 TaxID=3414028 RepID=UPI003CEBB18D
MRGLSAGHGEHAVLRGIDAELTAGEFVHLVGENGSGKSTLLRVAAGLHKPSGGEIRIGGHPPEAPEAKALRGYVQDEPPLYDYLSVHEQLAFTARLWGVPTTGALGTLERFGADQWTGHLIRELSLGTRKKVGIAVATLHNPRMILLDEPFNGLDHAAVRELTALLTEWKHDGRTVLAVSHGHHGLHGLVDRTLRLKEGLLVEGGSAPDLAADGPAPDPRTAPLPEDSTQTAQDSQ